MFDNRGMQTLSQFAKASPKTDKQWSEVLGISRSHFNMIRNGTAQPSKTLMVEIEKATSGAVPILAWFGGATQ